MLGETKARVIARGPGSREEDDRGLTPGLLRPANELAADAPALMGFAHCEVGQIGAVGEVAHAAGNPDHLVPIPGGDDKIGVAQHGLHPRTLFDGPPFTQRRSPVEFDHGFKVEVIAGPVGDGGHGC